MCSLTLTTHTIKQEENVAHLISHFGFTPFGHQLLRNIHYKTNFLYHQMFGLQALYENFPLFKNVVKNMLSTKGNEHL